MKMYSIAKMTTKDTLSARKARKLKKGRMTFQNGKVQTLCRENKKDYSTQVEMVDVDVD
jgi:hypothetical protein